jgi:RimJ/RimL family protein N-acetyltransferase
MNLDCGSCIVRDWRDGDRKSLVRFANNRRVWRNLKDRFPHPYTAAGADAWVMLARTKPELAGWAIEVDGLAAGCIGLQPLTDIYARTAHIGYWLGEPCWGRGIMTDAVRAVSSRRPSSPGTRRQCAFSKNADSSGRVS